jgi:hypothetical protein
MQLRRMAMGLAVALVLMAGSAFATPLSYSLLDLVQNNLSFTNGDKTFSNFEANLVISGNGSAVPADLSGIAVMPITMGGMYGVRLQGGIVATCTPNNCPITWDLLVSWNVSAASPYLIDGVQLEFNGNASNTISFAEVVETVKVGQAVVGSGFVDNTNLSTFIALNGAYSAIRVTKDILLFAQTENEQRSARATISYIDQYYHQVVPEPGTYALIGAGLLGLGLLRRRMS